MIDWRATNSPIETIYNKDRVIVVCEKCDKPRTQLYQVAKRKKQHICMSCSHLINRHKTGEIVEYICIDCGKKQQQQYRRTRFNNWRCHHCAMSKAHKDKKFNLSGLKLPVSDITRSKLSEIAKKRWQDPEYREKWKKTRNSTKEARSKKSKQLWSDPERKRNAAQSRAQQSQTISKIQLQLYNILNDLGIKYVEESKDTLFGFYSFDCLIPDKKLLIEVQGDYWHSLDKNIKNDRSKFTYIDKYFPDHRIIYIWEHEFKNIPILIGRLQTTFGITNSTIDFSFKNVVIKSSTKKDVKGFLDAYHYIGGNKNGFVYTANLNGELIACALFAPPIRQNIAQKHNLLSTEIIELSRFCIHPLRHKKNFASWFLAKTLKLLVGYKLVIAYSDSTVGHSGIIYKASGFTFSHRIPPNYWYISNDEYIINKKSVYDKARKVGLIEREFAQKNGYIKKYGGPKYCYIKSIR